jgi:hypothetical protein
METQLLLVGDPASAILRVTQELPADLIVMGTHGRTGLGRLLMGSVAEQVVRKAPCPVVTVKTPLPEKKASEVPTGSDKEKVEVVTCPSTARDRS